MATNQKIQRERSFILDFRFDYSDWWFDRDRDESDLFIFFESITTSDTDLVLFVFTDLFLFLIERRSNLFQSMLIWIEKENRKMKIMLEQKVMQSLTSLKLTIHKFTSDR